MNVFSNRQRDLVGKPSRKTMGDDMSSVGYRFAFHEGVGLLAVLFAAIDVFVILTFEADEAAGEGAGDLFPHWSITKPVDVIGEAFAFLT